MSPSQYPIPCEPPCFLPRKDSIKPLTHFPWSVHWRVYLTVSPGFHLKMAEYKFGLLDPHGGLFVLRGVRVDPEVTGSTHTGPRLYPVLTDVRRVEKLETNFTHDYLLGHLCHTFVDSPIKLLQRVIRYLTL